MSRRPAIILIGLLAAGCATRLPPVPLYEFRAGELEVVRVFFEEQVREGDVASGALFLNGLAQIELLMGETEDAWRHFRTAGRVMGNWQTSGSETFNAIVGSESSKTWKGDPYEKAMNAYYTGLLYLMRGEPDNARAAFKKGILADGETSEEKYQADFALLFWLAGRMSMHLGLRDEAADYFEEARQARAFAVAHGALGSSSNRFLENPGAGNLICLVDMGLGPEKYAAGQGGAMAAFRPRGNRERWVEMYLNGQSLGRTEVMTDLYYQAVTRGGTEMEGIRQGKAVFKSVTGITGVILVNEGLKKSGDKGRDQVLVGLGFMLLSMLTDSSADVRHWTILPETVQVLTAEVPPGEHELRLEFMDDGGREIPHLAQDWTVEVPPDGEGIYLFRSLPGLDSPQGVLR
jgi:hypothetical protein